MGMEKLLAALIIVESSGNNDKIGDNGRLGCLQISPAIVQNVNRHYGTNYKPTDALNRYKAKDIAEKYIRIYALPELVGRQPTNEDIARIWKKGQTGYKKEDTRVYVKKVQRALRRLDRAP